MGPAARAGGLAGAARLRADYGKAARLFGAVEALRETHGTREHERWRAVFDAEANEVHAVLGDTAFETAWAEGRAMTLDQAVAYALSGPA